MLRDVGWEAWQEVIVERAESNGPFEVVMTLQSPRYIYADETCPSSGPFRYRVTYVPPAGKYTQLESGPVTLDRDSVLIVDILEYVRIPEGMTLHYTNGMSMYCSYDAIHLPPPICRPGYNRRPPGRRTAPRSPAAGNHLLDVWGTAQ